MVLVVVACAWHVVWLHHFRHGLPLDGDESLYFGFALDDRDGLMSRGLAGLFDTVLAQKNWAPLVPMTAAPVLSVFGTTPEHAIAVELLFFVVLAGAAFLVGNAVAGRPGGFAVGTVTILSPVVIDFTRVFQLAIAAAAFFTLATAALIRSRRFSSWQWSLVFGAATGLMLVSRTFTLAFLPALAVASLLTALASPAPRKVVVRNVLVAAGSALVTAGWWYQASLGTVLHYLFDLGYGNRSSSYSQVGGPTHPRFWLIRLSTLVSNGLYVPTALVLAAAMVIFSVRWLSAHRGRKLRAPQLLDWSASPVGVVLVVLVVSYATLTSSRTKLSGGDATLVPLAAALGVAALVRLTHPLRTVLIAALTASVLTVAVTKTTVSGWPAEHRCIGVPAMGCLTVTDGRSSIQRLLARSGLDLTDPDAARRGAAGAWMRLSEQLARWIHHHRQAALTSPPVVVFATQMQLLNAATLDDAWHERYGSRLPVAALRVQVPGPDSERTYRQMLTDRAFGPPSFLITTQPGREDFPPFVTRSRAERAARAVGFRTVRRFQLPDDRSAALLARDRSP
jgi:hypothetical protein